MTNNVSVFKTLFSVWSHLSSPEKSRFGVLMILATLMALGELVLTALVALLAAIFASPEAVLQNASILTFQKITTITLSSDPRYLSFTVLIGIVLALFIKNTMALVHQWQVALLAERIGVHCRSKIFRFYQKAPYMWLSKAGLGDLFFGLSASAQMAPSLITGLQIFTSFLMIITLVAGLIVVSPATSFIFLVGLGFLGVFIVRITRNLLNRLSKKKYEADFKQGVISQLAIHGLKEVRIYARENYIFNEYRDSLVDSADASTKFVTFARLPVLCLEILAFVCLAAVMAFLLFMQESGMARISGIMGFLAAAAWRALPVANRLVDAVTGIRQTIPYIQKVTELLNLEKTMSARVISLEESNIHALSFREKICLNNVSFVYDNSNAPALTDVCLEIKKGMMVGVVGQSGAGKSTLVNMLTGLLVPDKGKIQIDDTMLCRDNIRHWIPHIGYVAQAPYIMDASLAENIALSRWGEAIDRERVMAVCKMAALDFVDKLENGIDTRLGERGAILSGGQAQRVAIARALYHEPEFIIFDEATSSLDLKNENAIYETILSLKNQVTMLVVAHRLATVQGCDHIVWLENGKLKMQGTPEEVLPIYRVYMGKQSENIPQ